MADSYVYFLQAGEGGPIKIGVTSDPWGRLASLQTGNHEPLTMLHATKGTPADEKQLHERFGALRLRGEWFRAEPSLVDFIAGMRWVERGAKLRAPEEVTVEGLTRAQVELVTRYGRLEELLIETNELDELFKGREQLEPDELMLVRRTIERLSLCSKNWSAAVDLFGRHPVEWCISTLKEIESVHGHAVAYLRVMEDARGGSTSDSMEVGMETRPVDPPENWGPLDDEPLPAQGDLN